MKDESLEEYKMKSDAKYVMVTTISTFRGRYCVPMDALKSENPDTPVNPELALDLVTCEEVEEFTQLHIGEQIIDYEILSQDQVLERFDKEWGNLSVWTEERKIDCINNWRKS
jgi:hypothetical protein|tara:strand:- start:422 stop:760 length:339 start_codon:yes stop_codon:yes gene_type:complete